MPIQVDRLKQDFKRRIRLLDAARDPVIGKAFNTAGVAVELLAESGSGFVAQTLVDGTLGAYTSNSFKEINDGWYQYCVPNLYMIPDTMLVIRARGAGADPWSNGIILLTGSKDLVMGQTTPAGSTIGGQLDKIVTAGTDVDAATEQNATRQFPTSEVFTAVASATLYSGSDWSQEFNDVGVLTIADSIEYSLKTDVEDDDDAAILTIRMSVADGKAVVIHLNGIPCHFDADVAMSYRDYIDPDEPSVTKQKIVLFLGDNITSQILPATYARGINAVGNSRVILQDTVTVARPVVRAIE